MSQFDLRVKARPDLRFRTDNRPVQGPALAARASAVAPHRLGDGTRAAAGAAADRIPRQRIA
jgi:hypothetical protein